MDTRNELAKRVGILGIIGNVFLFFIKIYVGIIGHSRAMIADSFNSAGDIFASFMTWIGNRISGVPNDDDHNYGHGKAEYIFSMIIGISMLVIAGKLLYDSIVSLINNDKIIYSFNLIIVCIITIIIKCCLFLYSLFVYHKYDNLLVKANMLDHRNDILVTSCSLIAIGLSKYDIFWVDGVVGIGISIWIFLVGIKIFIESYDVLMDTAIDKESQKKILKILKNYKEVKLIGDLYSVPIGYKYIVVLTIYVDGSMKTVNSHKVADEIENKILEEISKIEKVIIHVEPYDKK